MLLRAGAIGAGCGGDEVDVMLTRVGDRSLQVIREVRAANGSGLAEARRLIDTAPSTVVETMSRHDSERVQRKFEAAGAAVELAE